MLGGHSTKLMDFMLAMSIFCNREYFAQERREMMQKWLRARDARGVDVGNDNKGAGTAKEGEPEQRSDPRGQHARAPQAKKKLQGSPRHAPELDGLNCFETSVFQ